MLALPREVMPSDCVHREETGLHPMQDFQNPNKLGFMRFVQVMFAINIVITLVLLSTLSKGHYNLNAHGIVLVVNFVLDAVGFWLIWQRNHLARFFIAGCGLFNIAVSLVGGLMSGSFDATMQLQSSLLDIVLVVYFLTSRRAKAVLTRSFSDAKSQNDLVSHDADYYQPRTWPFWRNLIIYFCVFSVVGHWMEAAYCTLIRFGILPGIYDPNSQIWSDWLYPFCVYGFGAVACVLLLYPVKNFLQKKLPGVALPLFLSFVVGALVCSAIELTMGLIMNQPLPDGSLPLWDYRDMFCNFMGQICLQNAIAFGLVATLMTWIIYPGLEMLLAKIPTGLMNALFIVVVAVFAILMFLYLIDGLSFMIDALHFDGESAESAVDTIGSLLAG